MCDHENSSIGKFSRTIMSLVFYAVHTKHEYSAIGKKARLSVRTYGIPQENIKGFWIFCYVRKLPRTLSNRTRTLGIYILCFIRTRLWFVRTQLRHLSIVTKLLHLVILLAQSIKNFLTNQLNTILHSRVCILHSTSAQYYNYNTQRRNHCCLN